METSAWLAAIIAVAAVAVQIVVAMGEHKARAVAAQPRVSVDFRPDQSESILVRFTVQNTGASVARDVRITLEPAWESTGPFEPPPERLASLPPGRSMEWSVDSWPQRFDSNLPMEYLVTVIGTGPAGPFRDSYTLALSDWLNVTAEPPGTLKGIAKAIDRNTAEQRKTRQP